MIEIGFSIILGFAIASTLCGLIADGSRNDRILMRGLVYIIVLTCLIGYAQGEATSVLRHTQNLLFLSLSEHFLWFGAGASIALISQLIAEGHAYNLWIKFHPQSAPTPEARFGQRALPAGPTAPVSATLVGTSTEYLNAELDLRTETLIRLCFCTFDDLGALTLSRLESALRLGAGRRQKAFHKIAAGISRRPKLKPTLHRYSRSINGSSRLSQKLLGDLCRLARDTRNRDTETINRLHQTGRALGLHEDEIGRIVNGLR